MEQKVSDLAKDLFLQVLSSAEGLGNVTKEEQIHLFKLASEICFTAATTFYDVENDLKTAVDSKDESQ